VVVVIVIVAVIVVVVIVAMVVMVVIVPLAATFTALRIVGLGRFRLLGGLGLGT